MSKRNYTIAYALIAIFLLITPLHAKSGYRKIWVKAKKEGVKSFKESYEEISKLEKNKKKRQKLLKELGLNPKKSSLEKNIKFKSDLGPTLDKLRKAYGKYKTAVENNFISVKDGNRREILEKILENKKLYQEFFDFAQKESSEESMLFLQDAKKKSGPVLFETYIHDEAPLMINIGKDARALWMSVAENNLWKEKEYDEALAEAKKEVLTLLGYDTLSRFRVTNHSLKQAVMTEKRKVTNLIEQVREICGEYEKKIEDLHKNIKEGLEELGLEREVQDIEFHKILLEALEEVQERMTELENKLK